MSEAVRDGITATPEGASLVATGEDPDAVRAVERSLADEEEGT